MRNSKAFDIALMGIFLALGVMLMWAGSLLPGGTIIKDGQVSAVFVLIALYQNNLKNSLMLMFGTTLLSFFIIPNKFSVIYYIAFGLYSIGKFYIDEKAIGKIGIFYKLGMGIVLSCIITVLTKVVFIANSAMLDWKFCGIILMVLWIFVVYEVLSTLILTIYMERFGKKKLKDNFVVKLWDEEREEKYGDEKR